MARYSVSGTLVPDATTENTGEPKGLCSQGYPYWEWTNEAGTWQLKWDTTPEKYCISKDGLGPSGENPCWTNTGGELDVEGDYIPVTFASGTASVAEVLEDESSSSSSTSSGSSRSSMSSSSSSESSSQSSATVDLPRSCTITVSGSFSFTATVEKPT
jgi:hypothetical protein